MPAQPNDLGRRYLPFLVVAAVLALLVVVTPSRGTPEQNLAGGSSGAGADLFAPPAGSGPSLTEGISADATSGAGSDPALQAGSTSGPAAGGTTSAGGPAASGGGGGGSSTGPAGTPPARATGAVAGPVDRSRCDAKGAQIAPYFGMPACKPIFRGDNGGATMNGVTSKEIRYLYFRTLVNPVISGLLAANDLAVTGDQFCDGFKHFEASIEKRFEMYGRQLVPMDGPGDNAGSKNSDNCRYEYFQSRCTMSPADIPCIRAEAEVIASMKPAFVIAPISYPVLHQTLSRRGIISSGLDSASRLTHEEQAPYYYAVDQTGDRIVSHSSEYYCKRLVGKEPVFGGADVQAYAGPRRVGFVYPAGDPSAASSAQLFLKRVRACGDSEAQGYTYSGDLSKAQRDAATLAAQLRSDEVTTVVCFCDVFNPLFIMQAMDNNRYYPEHLTTGITTIATDAAGQAYTAAVPDQWKHAFGVSNYGILPNDSKLDYQFAYRDGGGTGKPAPLLSTAFGYMVQLGQMIHTAGPQLTPTNVARGLRSMPEFDSGSRRARAQYTAPDPWTWYRTMSEIYWDPNATSTYNGKRGAYCKVDSGRQYDLGQWPTTQPKVFTGGC